MWEPKPERFSRARPKRSTRTTISMRTRSSKRFYPLFFNLENLILKILKFRREKSRKERKKKKEAKEKKSKPKEKVQEKPKGMSRIGRKF